MQKHPFFGSLRMSRFKWVHLAQIRVVSVLSHDMSYGVRLCCQKASLLSPGSIVFEVFGTYSFVRKGFELEEGLHSDEGTSCACKEL